jgi:hypothetical protein
LAADPHSTHTEPCPWAFLATYPALIFGNQEIRSHLPAITANYLTLGLVVAITLLVGFLTVEVRRWPLERDYVGRSIKSEANRTESINDFETTR